MDHQEGFGRAVEGAGCQGVRFAKSDVAQVVIGVGRFSEGEFSNSFIAVILVIKQVLQRVKEIT